MAAHFAPACCPNLDHNAAGGTSDAQRNIIDEPSMTSGSKNGTGKPSRSLDSRRVRINHCLGTISTAQPPPASRRLADTASRISAWPQETCRIVAGTLPDQTCATTKPFILKTWITMQQHVTEHYRLHRDATSLAAKGFRIFGLWARKSISMRLQTTSNNSVEFVSSAAQPAMAGKAVQASLLKTPFARLSWLRNLVIVCVLDGNAQVHQDVLSSTDQGLEETGAQRKICIYNRTKPKLPTKTQNGVSAYQGIT